MSSKNEVSASYEDWDKEYRAFQNRAGVPVHSGLFVDDVRTLEVGEWGLTGGRGAFVNLTGMEGTCDVQIHEIPPGETLEPQRHLHDALVFVISGAGLTVLGDDEQNRRTFEWDTNAAFYLPQNTRYELARRRRRTGAVALRDATATLL